MLRRLHFSPLDRHIANIKLVLHTPHPGNSLTSSLTNRGLISPFSKKSSTRPGVPTTMSHGGLTSIVAFLKSVPPTSSACSKLGELRCP